jgi:hypothetical protein
MTWIAVFSRGDANVPTEVPADVPVDVEFMV